jgi:hypothetical protein
LAVQTGSLLPCVVFHATYNGLQLTISRLSSAVTERGNEAPWTRLISGEEPLLYQPTSLVLFGTASALVLWRFSRIPYQRTVEEQLQEQRELQDDPLGRASVAQSRSISAP